MSSREGKRWKGAAQAPHKPPHFPAENDLLTPLSPLASAQHHGCNVYGILCFWVHTHTHSAHVYIFDPSPLCALNGLALSQTGFQG